MPTQTSKAQHRDDSANDNVRVGLIYAGRVYDANGWNHEQNWWKLRQNITKCIKKSPKIGFQKVHISPTRTLLRVTRLLVMIYAALVSDKHIRSTMGFDAFLREQFEVSHFAFLAHFRILHFWRFAETWPVFDSKAIDFLLKLINFHPKCELRHFK